MQIAHLSFHRAFHDILDSMGLIILIIEKRSVATPINNFQSHLLNLLLQMTS
jgi:hypothetical protein